MPNLIQHKRSTTTRQPTLSFGEIGYTTNGDILYIGQDAANTSNVIAIGGRRAPGTLTANHAIVVNGNSWIDQIKTAKLIIGTDGAATENVTSISYFANSSQLGATAAASNNELVPSWAIKTYVDGKVAGSTGSPTGSNTQVQFNDSGAFGGDAGMTYNKTTDVLTIANAISVPLLLSNVTVQGNSTVNALTITGNSTVTEYKVTAAVANVQAATIVLAGTTATVSSNASFTANLVASGAVVNVAPTTLYLNGPTTTAISNTFNLRSNSTATAIAVVGNSTATYVVLGGSGTTVANVNSANAAFNGTNLAVSSNVAITDTTFTVTANTQALKANSTVTGLSITGNSTATYVLVGPSNDVVNVNPVTTNINGTNLNVNANLTVSDTSVTVTANTQTFKANTTVTGMSIVGNSTVTVVTLGSAASVTNVVSTNTFVTSTNTTINSNVTVNGTAMTVGANVTFGANVTITGDLIVNGATTVINVDTLSVEDSNIKVASNNSSTDTIDFGIYGVYGSGGAKYAGLFRDASNSGIFTLFTAHATEPTTTVDTSALTRGTLLANFTTDVFTANSTKVNITAGSMTTDLTVQDGGTGVSVFANNGIVFGQNTAALAVTAAGTQGQVLQAGASGVPVFSDLDGGTF